MEIKHEVRILSLPLHLAFFFHEIRNTPKKELRFWRHLFNNDYNQYDQRRLLIFLEEQRDNYEGAAKGCLLSLLGGLYIFTDAPHKNLQRGLSILKMAADLKNSCAIHVLGYVCELNKNYTKARQLYEVATGLDNPLSMNRLGLMHQEGLGTPVDVVKAALLYRQAWGLAYNQAKLNLQILGSNHPNNYPLQYHLQMVLTPGDIEDLLKKSPLQICQSVASDPFLSEFEKHAFFCSKEVEYYSNNPLLNNKLSALADKTLPTNPEHLFQFGAQFEKNKNFKQAIRYYEKAADLGSMTALFKIGQMYHYGKEIEQDFNKAMYFYLKAEAGFEPKAICGLGVMHYFGQGTPKDIDKAVIYFRRSNELSCPDARENLEKMRARHDSLFIQYNCLIALCRDKIHDLFKISEQEVTHLIIEDSLLSPDEKDELFLQICNGSPQNQIQHTPSFFKPEVDDEALDEDIAEIMKSNPHLFA